ANVRTEYDRMASTSARGGWSTAKVLSMSMATAPASLLLIVGGVQVCGMAASFSWSPIHGWFAGGGLQALGPGTWTSVGVVSGSQARSVVIKPPRNWGR